MEQDWLVLLHVPIACSQFWKNVVSISLVQVDDKEKQFFRSMLALRLEAHEIPAFIND